MKMMKLFLVLLLSLSFNLAFAAPECDGQFAYKIEGVVPYAQAFPEGVKVGALETRINDFITRWPNNVKKVNKVKMKVDLSTSKPVKERDFVVISTNGLNNSQQEELINDYLLTMANNTLSFPLGSGAGHLYTRVGTKTLDNLWGVSVKNYSLPGSDRLETVIALSDEEMENMRWYAEHALRNSGETVGGWNYDGTKETIGKINNNKCSTGSGHNCTSWMSLAPIGEEGESLKQMLGAYGFDMGRNPGWLTAYIHAYTEKARFPFAVFMSQKSMSEIDEMIATGKTLEWNYNLH